MESDGSGMSSEVNLKINEGFESDCISREILQSITHNMSVCSRFSAGQVTSMEEAGDVVDRVSICRRSSPEENDRLNGAVSHISEEFLETYGFWKHDTSDSVDRYPVSPLIEDIITLQSNDASLQKKQEEKKELPPFEYFSCLVHLAVFGILGVLTRYLLQILFGPDVLGITGHEEILYLDLPSNMVGSFLMGWLGVVFKSDISHLSDQLATGLSTGYLGSLTTFSSWNQEMLQLSSKKHWAKAGLFLCASSISFGVETANGFKKARKISVTTTWNQNHHLIALLTFLAIFGSLLATSAVMVGREFDHGSSTAQLWLGCLVAPFGVWVRWWLARLNGRGLGRAGWWKWVPFGTLIANVSAVCIMAALAALQKLVNTENCYSITTGIQLGLTGCLSTVSTFMAEFYCMRNNGHSRRAHAYAAITIVSSFALGTLIYSVPIWTRRYK